ncbi:MAG TPA: hypothetical protein DCS07_02360 [Bdellovibrionales bacterium]|nr:MAG: hypothetical protein A2Z97_14090 [Bdellovibrionales bacterium GWB1_52_6]OFZ06490.1 MAG: hypothetical protein A2X97_16860 [Bdellovibrionales bacterium GWA1_52_35]OFZ33107.1 MAG: hypothetical protein A2070_10120 [Bdellovibrionales bacterium GWC1_52_8]HAR41468.1 hypothetical protein [Bdellovibrionales bacterium]HCM39494.1 hypothetical protein [Bdellovibrionales bacterium]
MSVYARFKRNPDGFRNLVELLETTPQVRRQKMIDVGMQEDPDYTMKALEFTLNFTDIINLPEMELAELIAAAPPRTTGYAFLQAPEAMKLRVLQVAPPRLRADLKDYLSVTVGPREIGGAQLKMVEITRQLERKGLVKTKKIPA